MDSESPESGAQPEATVTGPLPWPNLPPRGWARTRTLVGRALNRRCPYCGGGNIFSNYFTIKTICPTCEVRFEREDGYFLGGYALNLVFSEFIGLGLAVYLLFFTAMKHWPLLQQEIVAVSLAVLFPLALFPFSRTVWMALDLTLNPPEENQERYFSVRDMRKRG